MFINKYQSYENYIHEQETFNASISLDRHLQNVECIKDVRIACKDQEPLKDKYTLILTTRDKK